MVSTGLLIGLVALFPLLGFLIIDLNHKRISHGVASFIGCGSVFLSFLLAITIFSNLLTLPEDQRSLTVIIIDWISTAGFSANISFLVDPLSSIFLLIITGVGFLIHVYSIGYMHDDP